MASERAIGGTVVQAEHPCWPPLKAALGTELARWFMWMHEVLLDDGTHVEAYKHVATRRYLHLSQTGLAFRYGADGPYRRVDLAPAITDAFEGWQRAAPRPRDLQLLAAAVASARDLAA